MKHEEQLLLVKFKAFKRAKTMHYIFYTVVRESHH